MCHGGLKEYSTHPQPTSPTTSSPPQQRHITGLPEFTTELNPLAPPFFPSPVQSSQCIVCSDTDVDAFPSSSRSACTRVDGTLRNDDEDDDDARGGGIRRLDVDVDATMRRLVVGMNESE